MGLVQDAQAIRIVLPPNAVNVEIAKLATNAMLSMKLTYMNVISSLCARTRGADINIVRQILEEDYRFDNNYMTPTLGIGGPELMKDTLYMKHAFLQANLYHKGMLTGNIAHLEKKKRKEFVQLMLEKTRSLFHRRIAIFGVTYKSGVLDLTESPAISICKALLRKRAFLRIYDPAVDEETILQALGDPEPNRVAIFGNSLDACEAAHVIAFLVPLPPQLLQLDFQVIHNLMTNEPGGRYLFIGWPMVDLDDLRQMGFTVHVSGKH